jgi:beta-N-acetylhexosaminidase
VDQEGAWGVLVGESTTGPGNLALGVADSGQGTEAMYKTMAEEMRFAGFNCILGPCCDVNFNPSSPIIDSRSFGDRPTKVALHAAAAVRGLHQGGICGSGKHFPGHGDTHGDTHREIPRVDKSLCELREQDPRPFQAAIDAGVDLIMTSHILYPQIDSQHPATLSSIILQDLLRTEMGFEGIIISDSMNMGAIGHHYSPATAAVLARKAGINMIMLSEEHYDHSDSYLDKQFAMIHGGGGGGSGRGGDRCRPGSHPCLQARQAGTHGALSIHRSGGKPAGGQPLCQPGAHLATPGARVGRGALLCAQRHTGDQLSQPHQSSWHRPQPA